MFDPINVAGINFGGLFLCFFDSDSGLSRSMLSSASYDIFLMMMIFIPPGGAKPIGH